jgi:hypothetical protein
VPSWWRIGRKNPGPILGQYNDIFLMERKSQKGRVRIALARIEICPVIVKFVVGKMA